MTFPKNRIWYRKQQEKYTSFLSPLKIKVSTKHTHKQYYWQVVSQYLIASRYVWLCISTLEHINYYNIAWRSFHWNRVCLMRVLGVEMMPFFCTCSFEVITNLVFSTKELPDYNSTVTVQVWWDKCKRTMLKQSCMNSDATLGVQAEYDFLSFLTNWKEFIYRCVSND